MSNFENEPPSYDHAVQSQLSNEQVYALGKYHDASIDSFEKGEMFIQAFLNQIDTFPANEVKDIQENGGYLNRIYMDSTIQNQLFQHPKATPRLPAIAQTSLSTFTFWPRYSYQPEDYDISLQASHAWLPLDKYGKDGPTLHYFEIKVVDKPNPDVVLAIGLSTKPYPVFRMPGWNKFSIGYHSDDGHKFCDDATGGQDYGPSWTTGDVVGCGYCPEQGRVFFTLNGRMVGDAFQFLETHAYYPTVGADGPATIHVNFGRERFHYSIPQWAGQFI
jgi:hypothetical protein